MMIRFKVHAADRGHVAALRLDLGEAASDWRIDDIARGVTEASFSTAMKANEVRSATERVADGRLMVETLARESLFTGEAHKARVNRANDILGNRWAVSDEVKWDEDGFGHRLAADIVAIDVLERLRTHRSFIEAALVDVPRRLLLVLESDCARVTKSGTPPADLEGEPLGDGFVLLYGERALVAVRFDFETEASKFQLMPQAPKASVYYVTSRGRGCFIVDGVPQ